MQLSNTEAFSLSSAAERQRRVVFALMLRNIRTRFFGHGLGYLIAIAWPLSHIIIVLGIYTVMGRAAPYGDSIVLFVATGTVPFMVFSYVSRFMMISVLYSRPLLAFPQVTVMDMLLASAALEALALSCVIIIFVLLAWFFDINSMPRDIVEASYAFGVAFLLGIGYGLLSAVMVLATRVWVTWNALLMAVLWFTAGIVFVPDSLPSVARDVLYYHPILQVIEWLRSAYYEGYGDLVLDRSYVVGFGLVVLFLGLLLERAMRGHLLAQR